MNTLTEDVLKSSEIEGEKIDRDQVRSSIARRLGIETRRTDPRATRDVEGVVEMMLDATQHYGQPLKAQRLFDWHAALFPTGRSGISRINNCSAAHGATTKKARMQKLFQGQLAKSEGSL